MLKQTSVIEAVASIEPAGAAIYTCSSNELSEGGCSWTCAISSEPYHNVDASYAKCALPNAVESMSRLEYHTSKHGPCLSYGSNLNRSSQASQRPNSKDIG